MRELFVTDLVKEVLGPREGIHEIMRDRSPLDEYLTGVLAPVMSSSSPPPRDINNEAELPTADTESYDDDNTADSDQNFSLMFSPALDPQSRPPSMGISFIVESPQTAQIDICVTWARYRLVGSDDWQREPRAAVVSVTQTSDRVFFFNESGTVSDSDHAEISLHLLFQPQTDNQQIVTIYFVNRIRVPAETWASAAHHIFQPQIRVSCSPGTKIVPGLRSSPSSADEQNFEFLYRDRPLLARGHLCSAIWKGIDPEAISEVLEDLDFPNCARDTPFRWLDGDLLSQDISGPFSPPDVRTEFVPLYSIPGPDYSWFDNYRVTPELSAGNLAQLWDVEELRSNLTPIADGYQRWIDEKEQELLLLPEEQRRIAVTYINKCRDIQRRIVLSIDLLCSDSDARLAFCFANKAMDIQSYWSPRRSPLTYWPFQLAYFLICIESIVNPRSDSRSVVDLLWIPTGGGKTEAYLAVAAFTLAYRRRRSLSRDSGDRTGAGVSIITRYTLRLLTIQQFRRTLSLISACEKLRVHNLLSGAPVGWRPDNSSLDVHHLWGTTPFNIGLWVGGGVTPNRMGDMFIRGRRPIPGALTLLKVKHPDRDSEPAQVLNCPACGNILAIPETGLHPGQYSLHFVIRTNTNINPAILGGLQGMSRGQTHVEAVRLSPHEARDYSTLSFDLLADGKVRDDDIDQLWDEVRARLRTNGIEASIVATRASRPGYFIRSYRNANDPDKSQEYDFELFCPNPACPLHVPWYGGAPNGWLANALPVGGSIAPSIRVISPGQHVADDGNRLIHTNPAFAHGESPFFSDRIPIPALTVDEQIYQKLPSVIVATVDKFARPPFEARASGFFGNVEYHHAIYGFYRRYLPRNNTNGHPIPAGKRPNYIYQSIQPLDAPDLIIQDELHLIEGPLGSLMGLYETAVDFLCREVNTHRIKYIASTATIRRAEHQVQAIFTRDLQLFPPQGLTSDDRFFVRNEQDNSLHILQDNAPGRLYLGICAPGRGALTPSYRIWARLLETAYIQRDHPHIDPYWTLTGYYNAIRELGGGVALYRQDIPQRLHGMYGTNARPISEDRAEELSGRRTSTDLPGILDTLGKQYPNAADALFTTSMFGTGVDIPRIGLMVVHGQPKTTSAYIQSTGRVGRSRGALVVTLLRATRPRDLNHYEFFAGYHHQLHRFVEPITVYPFSPGALVRAGGPVGVFILRNRRNGQIQWHIPNTAPEMARNRMQAPEVQHLSEIFEDRSQQQPEIRRPVPGDVRNQIAHELDNWQLTARNSAGLQYVEYAIDQPPQHPVVLGDPQHTHAGLDVVYENAPQSLRDIEETTGFQTDSSRQRGERI